MQPGLVTCWPREGRIPRAPAAPPVLVGASGVGRASAPVPEERPTESAGSRAPVVHSMKTLVSGRSRETECFYFDTPTTNTSVSWLRDVCVDIWEVDGYFYAVSASRRLCAQSPESHRHPRPRTCRHRGETCHRAYTSSGNDRIGDGKGALAA